MLCTHGSRIREADPPSRPEGSHLLAAHQGHDCRQTADTYTSLHCDQAGRWHKLGAGLGLVVATLAAVFGGEFARDLVLGAAH